MTAPSLRVPHEVSEVLSAGGVTALVPEQLARA